MPAPKSLFRLHIHPSWIFYAAVWGIIVGIIATSFIKQVYFAHFLWLVVSLLLLLFTLHFSRPLFIIIAFLAGFIGGNFRLHHILTDQQILAQYIGQVVTVSGRLSEAPDLSDGQVTLKLHQLELHFSDSNLALTGTLYVRLSGAVPDLLRSDQVVLEGKLGAGFGIFVGTLFRPELISVTRDEPGDIFAKLSQWFSAQIHEFIVSPAADLGLGYLIGQKSGLPEVLMTALSAVGMTHVVVASGTHLGILVGLTKKLFGKLSKFAGLFSALVLMLGFVMLIGFTPSMTRAALVTSLSLIFGYFGRRFTPLRLLSFVACLTLLINPTNFNHLAWQLSFASFCGILIFAPRLQKLLYGGKRPPWLASMLITSISTSLVCAPILIYNFGSISVLALVANLIILPTLPYAMLLVFLTGLTSPLPFCARIFAWLATQLLNFHIMVINFLSQQKMFIFALPSGDSRVYIIYLMLLIFLIGPEFWKFIKRKCYNKSHED